MRSSYGISDRHVRCHLGLKADFQPKAVTKKYSHFISSAASFPVSAHAKIYQRHPRDI
jgi:hypothetical protein